MKRLLLALAGSLALATAAQAQTVIVVRHAEKADQDIDPVLSAAGEARAAELASTLASAGVTHVFTTSLERTRLTGRPTAQAFSLTPVEIDVSGGMAMHVGRIVEEVRALPADSVVLIVGHSNTVPDIVRGLGGQAAPMTDCEYDRLSIVTLAEEGAHVIRGRYGAHTEPCEAG